MEAEAGRADGMNNNAVRQLFNVDNLSIYKLIFGITFRFLQLNILQIKLFRLHLSGSKT